MNLFTLTRKLIDIPSITGDESAVGHFLHSQLTGLGYNVETQQVAHDRFNVIATTTNSPTVVFSTHMDTVPPFTPSSEDDETIHGRGACDAKGIIAAQIFAAEQLRSEGIKNFGLLFTVDEELASTGARIANNHLLAPECSYLVNGEPTDNLLAVGTKGSMRVLITTHGRAAHSAYPEAGDSAIEKLLDVLQMVRTSKLPSNSFFGDTTCNIGLINGGTRPNVIPAAASAEMQIRLASNIDDVKRVIENAVAGRAIVEYLSAHDPIKLLSVPGFNNCVVRFTTDIPYLSNWGKPLLIGPGSILVAHTDRESIAKKDLEIAVDLYVRLAKTLLAKDLND